MPKRAFFYVLFLLITMQPLQGCLTAAIATATGVGGYLAKQHMERTSERHRGKIRREERRIYEKDLNYEKQVFQAKLPSKDQQIYHQLNNMFMGGSLTHVMAIKPQVQNNNVTLTGVVPSPVIADRAVAAARKIPGVRSVTSRLMINERRIEPILGADGRPVRTPYPHQPHQVPTVNRAYQYSQPNQLGGRQSNNFTPRVPTSKIVQVPPPRAIINNPNNYQSGARYAPPPSAPIAPAPVQGQPIYARQAPPGYVQAPGIYAKSAPPGYVEAPDPRKYGGQAPPFSLTPVVQPPQRATQAPANYQPVAEPSYTPRQINDTGSRAKLKRMKRPPRSERSKDHWFPQFQQK